MENLIITDKDVSNLSESVLMITVVEGVIVHATTPEESAIELKELVQAAGSEVKAEIMVHQCIDEDYYLDKESLTEASEEAKKYGVNTIVTIDQLTGNQMKNMEKLTGMKIVDRTMLILDILSKRAVRREGKLEIEKAQLRYRQTRIEGFQDSYKYRSGIGVFGPNGKRLPSDEREILDKINSLDIELSIIVKNRFVQRSKKIGDRLPLVAFAGYTNSGKSTLMNKLIEMDPYHEKESEVIVKENILSTVDVSLRKAKLPNGKEFLAVDTIGFVSDIPGIVRAAFRSTFEEVSYADLILKVYDISSDDMDTQMQVIDYTIEKIGATNKKVINVYNKADKLPEIPESEEGNIYISAKSGLNLDKLLNAIEDALFEEETLVKLLIPYDKYETFNKLKDERILEFDDIKHTKPGIEISIVMNKDEIEEYREFLV